MCFAHVCACLRIVGTPGRPAGKEAMGWHRPYKERKFAVGQRLLTLRTRAKLTQTELAGLVGVNRRSLQNWESGAGYPKEDGLQRLIAVFLAQGVFTPGHEREEAERLWAQVSQDAPRPLALFDDAWFAGLLVAQPVSHDGTPAPVAPTDASVPTLPTGLVTFLGTDIEGSTQRWEQAPQAMQQAVMRHHAILRQLTALYHGQVFHTAGDSFICVFDDASAALQSALAIQRALLAEPWPEAVAPLRVRMALHSGAASATPDGYVAEPTLNRLSRVLTASHGGQILLTQAAVDLIGAGWPDGVTRRDLGVQQLRDVTVPIQLWQALAPDLPTDVPLLRTATAAAPHVDWGEAIDVPALYGREPELATLEQWVLNDRCRTVALLGLGGIGKTSLALTLAQQHASRFDAVVFRSLRNAPRPGPLLDDLILVVSGQQASPAADVPDKIAQLLQLMRTRRCLLVLDNLETVMQVGGQAGAYRDGYTEYGEFVQRLAEAPHQSCLVITSREKPRELGPLEGRTAPVRTLLLSSLPASACRTILEEKEVSSSDVEIAALAQLYGGNPLALKLVSEPIRELFGGDVGAFLATGDAFMGGVGNLLEQQFARSAPLEQALLFWLAIARDLVPLDRLLTDLAGAAGQREVLVALESLRRRLLIERGAGQPAFTLQPVILEYLTDRLVREVCQEILANQPNRLRSHALMQATAKDYVRRSQEQLIGQAVLAQVIAAQGGSAETERHLRALLSLWRGQPQEVQGYGPGNVANLLRLLCGHLRGLDLSHLAIRQAYLQEVEAQDMRFAHAHLTQSVLAEAFDYTVSVALSADGAQLVAGTSNGEVRLWRVASRMPLVSMPGHLGLVRGVALSADGRLVASCSHDGTVKLWAMPAGQLLATLQGNAGPVWSVAVNANGQLIASGHNDGTIKLWDAPSRQLLTTLHRHTSIVYGVALDANGRLVASGGNDGSVKLWDAPSRQLVATLQEHMSPVRSIALSGNGQLVVCGSADGSIKLWDAPSRKLLGAIHGHTSPVYSVALSVDERFVASGSNDGTIKLWAVENNQILATLQGHIGPVYGVAMTVNGVLASGSMDGTIKLWEAEGGQPVAILQGHTGQVWSVAMSKDGRVVASGSLDGTVKLWDAQHGHLLSILRGHVGLIYGVALSPDGQLLASSSNDGTVKLWKVNGGQLLASLRGHDGPVWGVAVSPDGQFVASGGDDRTVKLWATGDQQLRGTLQGHTGLVYSTALGAGGLLASGSADGTVKLWSVPDGRLLASLQGHRSVIWAVATSEDGQLVASGSLDGTVKLWSVSGAQLLATFQHHSPVYGVSLSSDGKLIASGGADGTIKLWAAKDGEPISTLQGHDGPIYSVVLSGDGQVVASGGLDGTVKLWATASGTLLRTLRSDRRYERMDITGLTGVSEAQRAALIALGAVEQGD